MNNFMSWLILNPSAPFLLLLPLAGCSTITTTTNYEIAQNKSLQKTHIYDWCEENRYTLGMTGPDCGTYRPPVYSYKYGSGYYVFYPMLIGFDDVAFGPPILPIIPLIGDCDCEGQTTVRYKVRLHTGNAGYSPAPETVEIYQGNVKYTDCSLGHSSSDDIGDVFECDLSVDTAHTPTIDSVLTLSDGKKIKIEYVKKETWTYKPLIAPNGGDWHPAPYIKFDE